MDSNFQFLVARLSTVMGDGPAVPRSERVCCGTEGSNPSPSAIGKVFIKCYQYLISYLRGLTHKSTRASFVDAGGLTRKILDASSWPPPVSWLTQSSAVAKISGLRSSLRQPHCFSSKAFAFHTPSGIFMYAPMRRPLLLRLVMGDIADREAVRAVINSFSGFG
jgi:hypothetical protein